MNEPTNPEASLPQPPRPPAPEVDNEVEGHQEPVEAPQEPDTAPEVKRPRVNLTVARQLQAKAVALTTRYQTIIEQLQDLGITGDENAPVGLRGDLELAYADLILAAPHVQSALIRIKSVHDELNNL